MATTVQRPPKRNANERLDIESPSRQRCGPLERGSLYRCQPSTDRAPTRTCPRRTGCRVVVRRKLRSVVKLLRRASDRTVCRASARGSAARRGRLGGIRFVECATAFKKK